MAAKPIRVYEARDQTASQEAYRRGREAAAKSAGATPVNPFLLGTIFHQAFALGVTEADMPAEQSSFEIQIVGGAKFDVEL